MLSIKRAGADIIFTYFAERIAKLIEKYKKRVRILINLNPVLFFMIMILLLEWESLEYFGEFGDIVIPGIIAYSIYFCIRWLLKECMEFLHSGPNLID